ncbi:ion channel [Aliidiomarina celeris]|uniref:ion channel n=1 Tax=Aliidiomarina celeris TaxID=2249428 RepID=UPI000DE95339|nr:ion channel [Aliidiomarina celeris]
MQLTPVDFLIVAVTIVTVILTVVLHHEVSSKVIFHIENKHYSKRKRMFTLVFSMICTHIAQIWMFAVASFLLLKAPDAGSIVYHAKVEFLDLVYLSASSFTTMGYGDIIPEGSIRFLYGTEAVTGFTLITWSASLTFLEMQKHWLSYIRPSQD